MVKWSHTFILNIDSFSTELGGIFVPKSTGRSNERRKRVNFLHSETDNNKFSERCQKTSAFFKELYFLFQRWREKNLNNR